MKFASFLIVSIFTWILWTSVKTTIPTQKGLADGEVYTAEDLTKTSNDGTESSANPQTQNYEENLTKKGRYGNKGVEKVFNRSECNKKYYQKNKEKINEYQQTYYKRNRSERIQYQKSYYQKNIETELKKRKIYHYNHKEKLNEYKRKWRQEKKKSDHNEGTSFVNPQTDNFNNKGKLPIVCQESFQEGNLFNQGEEECNNGEDEQNQIEVEEPNKIIEDNTNHIDLNKKLYSFDLNEKPFDLNEMPEDEELENY
ncbi:unnamed protein product [Meloidogyne enterolobii]|uniref:Uncharacterized protein n=1 Tax=Meloidogyne enterolobii TaxID=390850 RepID=A0ACB0YCD3_MELEN